MSDFDSEIRRREHEFSLKLDEMNNVILSHELQVRQTSLKTSLVIWLKV